MNNDSVIKQLSMLTRGQIEGLAARTKAPGLLVALRAAWKMAAAGEPTKAQRRMWINLTSPSGARDYASGNEAS